MVPVFPFTAVVRTTELLSPSCTVRQSQENGEADGIQTVVAAHTLASMKLFPGFSICRHATTPGSAAFA